MRYFKPYEGDKPYIFISYAHADSDAVMSVVTHMHDRGYRIWYDEGIEVGSEWPECIASHLTGAQLVIAFISNSYMRSDNCRREMHYALSKRIRIINVFIENTDMTPGMEMQIGSIFALMRHNMSDEEFYGKLYSAPLLDAELFADGGAPAEAETLTDRDRFNEYVMTRLRTAEGIDLREAERLFGKERAARVLRDAEPWLKSRTLVLAAGRMAVPPARMLISDAVIETFFETEPDTATK